MKTQILHKNQRPRYLLFWSVLSPVVALIHLIRVIPLILLCHRKTCGCCNAMNKNRLKVDYKKRTRQNINKIYEKTSYLCFLSFQFQTTKIRSKLGRSHKLWVGTMFQRWPYLFGLPLQWYCRKVYFLSLCVSTVYFTFFFMSTKCKL